MQPTVRYSASAVIGTAQLLRRQCGRLQSLAMSGEWDSAAGAECQRDL